MAENLNSATTAGDGSKMPEVDAGLINPLDKNASDGKMPEEAIVSGVVSTATSTGDEKILEMAPTIDTSLLEGIAPQKTISLPVLKVLLGILIIASLAGSVFFTSQLTDRFGFLSSIVDTPNVSQNLAAKNTELISLQNDMNQYRFLQIKSALDDFSFEGDSYMQQYEISISDTVAKSEKNSALKSLDALNIKLGASFEIIKDLLLKNFVTTIYAQPFTESNQTPQTLFQQELTAKLNADAAQLVNSEDAQAKRDYKNYIQTVALVGNQEFKNLIIGTDFKALSNENLYLLIKKINTMIINDLSIIQEIKDKRIKWSDIMNEIELRTIAVDNQYTKDRYELVGGIRYTNYDFDTKARKISIVGSTKAIDTTNFTMISNLIDELNASKYFANAEMRSFSKSGDFDEGYTASLKLSFDLKE